MAHPVCSNILAASRLQWEAPRLVRVEWPPFVCQSRIGLVSASRPMELSARTASHRMDRLTVRHHEIMKRISSLVKRNSVSTIGDCRLTSRRRPQTEDTGRSQDTAGSPTRRRAQTWRSFFIAPCASFSSRRGPRCGRTAERGVSARRGWAGENNGLLDHPAGISYSHISLSSRTLQWVLNGLLIVTWTVPG